MPMELDRPFAETGEREDFNENTSPSGDMSLEKGFTALYELKPEEGGLFILRKKFNQLLYLISDQVLKNKQAINQAIGNIQAMPIGAILNGYTIFDNCIVAFGGEFNRSDYPKLWEYLQANPSLVKTQAQWQTEATKNGGICGFYSDGDGTTTFRVPNLDKAFLRPDSRGAGSFQGDTIREIAGEFSAVGSNTTTGPFEVLSSTAGSWSSTNSNVRKVGFKASNVVPTANENRPKNIAILPLIVAK